MFIIARVLGTILLSKCFVKSLRNTHRMHIEYDWSVYWLAFRLPTPLVSGMVNVDMKYCLLIVGY